MAPLPQIDLSYGNLQRIDALPKAQADQEYQKIKQQIDAIAAVAQPAAPQMDATQFLKALATLDLTKPDNLTTFLNQTQAQDIPNLPKPVPLGSHDGIQYFLKSNGKAFPVKTSAVPPNTKPTDWYPGIFTYSATHAVTGVSLALDLKYGFSLGRLLYKPAESTPPTEAEDAGFYLLCNAVDKSIYAAFDFLPYAETGDIAPVYSEEGWPYGQLPGDKSKLVVGVMKVFGKEWTVKQPPSLDGGDPFRTGSGAGTPLPAKVVGRPALLAEVLKAIQGGGASAAGPAP
ncbi:hypothetical protein MMC18_007233 [Xylographa bjoerkii]|nr:hypothetical protein [Xylographa bjoerkii]